MSSSFEMLQERIRRREAVLGVVGLGYVGLPLVQAFEEAGLRVLGVDVSEEKVAALQRGESYVEDVPSAWVRKAVEAGRFRPSTDYAVLREADVVLITVPTPLSKSGEPDLSYVVQALQSLLSHLHPGMLVVLESTTYPGTTEEMVRPMLEEAGFRVGEEIFLGFSPERINPGDPVWTVRKIPKVVGGVDPRSTALMEAFYGLAMERVFPVSSARAAEMAKLLENTFRNVNIALVNEIAQICHLMGLDVWEVIEAAATKPFGFMKFLPGPGIGGHCIPVDPKYLTWKARQYRFVPQLVEVATTVNAQMPLFVVSRIVDLLNAHGVPVRGARILLLGVAYKPNVGDVRESPALDLLEELQKRQAKVAYHDPHVPEVRLDGGMVHRSVPLTPEGLQEQDLVVITTDHDRMDYARLLQHARRIFDTRNALRRRFPKEELPADRVFFL